MKLTGQTKRNIIFSLIAGVIVSFCYVAGYQLDTVENLNITNIHFYTKWFTGFLISSAIIACIWWGIDFGSKRKVQKAFEREVKYADLICVIFLLLCWLPAFLSIYPGVFAYDAYDEWLQVRSWNITAHHPVLHVLLAGGLAEGCFQMFGSYNLGLAIYSVLQMMVQAIVLTATIRYMRKRGVSRLFRIAALLFYGLSPVTQLFAICNTKDVFFTAAEVMFFMYVLRMITEEDFLSSKKNIICFAIASLCTVIFRNNGLYIVIFACMIIAVFYWKKMVQNKKHVFLFLAILWIPYILYTGPFYAALDVEAGGVQEMLSVPLQQMARVYRYDYDSISQEDKELLYSYVGQEYLERYRPMVADFVKSGFNSESFAQDKISFFKLWLRLGIKNPMTYINSFLVNTVDGWYPNALIDGYSHGDGRGSWFDYKVAPPGEEVVLLQGVHDYYERISHDLEIQKKPLAFLVMSPGWYFVCTLVIMLYFWSRQRYNMLVPCMILVLHMLTVLLGPMILVRYMLIFYYIMPLLIAMAIYGEGIYGKKA